MTATARRSDRTSLRAFARGLGVTLHAVQQAIADGRLTTVTVGRDRKRRPYIRDVDAARAEWEAHTRPRVAATQQHGPPPTGGSAATPSALAVATQRERDARAKLAEFDYQRKTGEYVRRADYERAEAARIVAARTALLGLPTRAKQRLPHLMASDLAELDKLVREVLEELAGNTDNHDGGTNHGGFQHAN